MIGQNVNSNMVQNSLCGQFSNDHFDPRLRPRAMRQRFFEPAAANACAIRECVARSAELDQLSQGFLHILGFDQQRDAPRTEGALPPRSMLMSRELNVGFRGRRFGARALRFQSLL